METVSHVEWRVLALVSQGMGNTRALANAVNRSISRTSALVMGLERKGFLTRQREGLAYHVMLADRAFTDDLRHLVLDAFPMSTTLSGSSLTTLSVIADAREPLHAKDIAWLLGFSKSSVSLTVQRAIRHGVLKKVGRRYRFGDRMDVLRNFLVEYSEHSHSRRLSDLAKDAVALWHLGPEFIFATRGELQDGVAEPTGITAFSQHGVQILSDRFYYHVLHSAL